MIEQKGWIRGRIVNQLFTNPLCLSCACTFSTPHNPGNYPLHTQTDYWYHSYQVTGPIRNKHGYARKCELQ